MKFLRDFIKEGDTLVSLCVDFMLVVLKSDKLVNLIKNEKEGLKDNYNIFLKTLPEGEVKYSYDRKYLEALSEIERANKIRKSSITALNAFKKAHNKMVEKISKRQDIKEIYKELLDLIDSSAKLSEIIIKAKKKK